MSHRNYNTILKITYVFKAHLLKNILKSNTSLNELVVLAYFPCVKEGI